VRTTSESVALFCKSALGPLFEGKKEKVKKNNFFLTNKNKHIFFILNKMKNKIFF
jgi:hypothetical protein